nr:reverse transcriptase domain-containing protein [Tanacetum cinerariifolium]
LGLLGHPFNIDLMPVELGSFDVIIGMYWLANHHAVIICDEKIVRIPYVDEVLIVQGDRGGKGEKSKLSIISCTKAQKYIKREQLSRAHSTLHVSNLKKCFVDETLAIPLDEIQFDDKLNFIEEPVEIMDREVKQLKKSRIPIMKVRWNSRRGPEFT